MTDYEKAIDLLNKINGQVIKQSEWEKASDYARFDLKRKVLIVIKEVEDSEPSRIGLGDNLELRRELSRIYWGNVRKYLNEIVETKKITNDNE